MVKYVSTENQVKLGFFKKYLTYSENYDNHLAIAACETAASFIINGSSRNLDYYLLKKLGPFTSDHRIRNFITSPAFLSDPYTVVRSSSVFTHF